MSFLSRAQTQLFEAVKSSRSLNRTARIKGDGSQQQSIMEEGGGGDDEFRHQSSSIMSSSVVSLQQQQDATASKAVRASQVLLPPPPAKLTGKEEEKAAVRTLEIARFDETRQFPGLAKQRVAKKDRHMKALDDFSKLLDNIAEGIEQNVLNMSRALTEAVEDVDASLRANYKQLEDAEFLTVRSEQDLLHILEDLKGKVANRLQIVETFAVDLDGLETKRAEVVGTELKLLVDRLIAIANQLPDEIETGVVEPETFDLNSVLTTNRKAHAQLMGLLRKTQVEVHVEMLQRWEDGRQYWRQLRHDKALADFGQDITSTRFEAPRDRQELMESVRYGQEMRHRDRQECLAALAALTSDNINSDRVTKIQQELAAIGDSEISAIQECYNGLGELRSSLRQIAKDRVEDLRKELHEYGALHEEPNLKSIARIMQQALEDESLAELWRLGGGLKTDFQNMSSDLCSIDTVYEKFVLTIQERLELICCGFNLKAVLQERGRLMQLDKIRNFITKMRSVPRNDVPNVLNAIIPELEEMMGFENIAPLFRDTVGNCLDEMRAELERVKNFNMLDASLGGGGDIGGAMSEGTSKKSASKSGGGSRSTAGGKSKKSEAPPRGTWVDPTAVKLWSRKLGILYFCSDLPIESQTACLDGLLFTAQQQDCNRKVDFVVLSCSDKILLRMDQRYRRLIDEIANFLEAQASFLALCVTNLGDFFLLLAKLIEEHRKEQKTIDDKSADELWDMSEEFRLEREDREVLFEEACQVLRASTGHEELQINFEEVLRILEKIQDSYRSYHSNACFAADRYPLVLVDEFRRYLVKVASMFNMSPKEDHSLLVKYEHIFDETIRLNRSFFEANPSAGGVEPRKLPAEALDATTQEVAAVNEEGAQEGTAAEEAVSKPEKLEPVGLFESPLLQQQNADENVVSLSGAFYLSSQLENVALRFTEEKELPPEVEAAPSVVAMSEGQEAVSVEASSEDKDSSMEVTRMPPPEPHPDCLFVKIGAALPLSLEQEQALDAFDVREYKEDLTRSFILLDEQTTSTLSPEVFELYSHCHEIYKETKERLTAEADPLLLRSNVPVDDQGTNWVLKMAVEVQQMSTILGGIRDSLVVSLEKEAARRLTRAQIMTTDYKADYTEELEDRLRTHWPRRGRVETGIKQPREAELLGHEEKTWRHIQAIQQRMIDLQKRFFVEEASARKKCDDYVMDMGSLRNSLSGEKFRNLAMLQGVDVKARGYTIAFQAACVEGVKTLQKITEEDINAVIFFAKDFRKVCPPQEPGVEGGYSEAEILEIEALVVGQCEEAAAISLEWKKNIEQLTEQQEQSLKNQSEFSKMYEKVAQNLAMSEGLGQKYGAPRRRAQERIRTEVSRDEQSAGKVDEMLAQLQFICDEAKRERTEGASNNGEEETKEEQDPNGRIALNKVNSTWELMSELRSAVRVRAEYLRVIETVIPTPDLPWMAPDRIPSLVVQGDDSSLNDLGDGSTEGTDLAGATKKLVLLEEVFEEVDAACRKETRELYESEGMGSVLGEGGVPDSLQQWLSESREKLLGPNGHREKAWKRLWAQIERLELILCRKQIEDDKEEIPVSLLQVGVPAVCLRGITNAFLAFASYERAVKEENFAKLVRIWEKGREKHERLLRPRLGSPDAAEELTELDAMEQERSKEMVENVIKFQGMLVCEMVEHAKHFCEDLGVSAKGLLVFIDSSLRLDALKLPPGTAIPKKRKTLKRMRKTERLRQAVAQGAEDREKERVWQEVPSQQICTIARSFETLVPNLEEVAAAELASQAPAAVAPTGKSAAPPPKKGEPAAVVAPVESPTLVSKQWLDTLAANTALRGAVTHAHRVLIQERDLAVARYAECLAATLAEIKEQYGSLLSGEESWRSRWRRQVALLRNS